MAVSIPGAGNAEAGVAAPARATHGVAESAELEGPEGRARALSEAGTLQELRRIAAVLSRGNEEAVQAAQTLRRLADIDPRRLGGVVSRIAQHLALDHVEVVALAGETLALLAQAVPAKVAKHSDAMVQLWPEATSTGRNAIVRTLIGLCEASVVYQRRLGPHLERALAEADLDTLVTWAADLLPVLKGEPYANARAIAEERLADLPRDEGRAACATVGVSYRGRPVG